MKHLIHIGYPKAASTFLQEWFYRHPQLQFNYGGMAGFHDIYEVCRQAASVEPPSNYKYFVTSSENIAFPDASAGSLPLGDEIGNSDLGKHRAAQEKACEILKELFPDAAILLVTRGFAGFLISAYSQYARTGGILSWKDFSKNFLGHTAAELTGFLDYDYLYKLYTDRFGEAQMIVLPFELLRDDKKKFLSILEARLELEHFDENIGFVNESLSAGELFWYPRISARTSRLLKKFGSRAYRRFYPSYVYRLDRREFTRLAGFLCRWETGEKIQETDAALDSLKDLNWKTETLHNNPLYKPYAAQYFFGER